MIIDIACKEAYKLKSSYHILLNTDVYFKPWIIEELIKKANSDTTIVLLMPKIVSLIGSTQHLCKLLPTPKDLILRRFYPLKNKKRLKNRYKLHFLSCNTEAEIPVLSGCFIIVRTSILKNVKGFNHRFFMYLEDVDICRRIGQIS